MHRIKTAGITQKTAFNKRIIIPLFISPNLTDYIPPISIKPLKKRFFILQITILIKPVKTIAIVYKIMIKLVTVIIVRQCIIWHLKNRKTRKTDLFWL